jgi:hypothetical protein
MFNVYWPVLYDSLTFGTVCSPGIGGQSVVGRSDPARNRDKGDI